MHYNTPAPITVLQHQQKRIKVIQSWAVRTMLGTLGWTSTCHAEQDCPPGSGRLGLAANQDSLVEMKDHGCGVFLVPLKPSLTHGSSCKEALTAQPMVMIYFWCGTHWSASKQGTVHTPWWWMVAYLSVSGSAVYCADDLAWSYGTWGMTLGNGRRIQWPYTPPINLLYRCCSRHREGTICVSLPISSTQWLTAWGHHMQLN